MLDTELMEMALQEAAAGLAVGLMPIGAVLAVSGRVVARAHWQGAAKGLLGHPERVLLTDADRSFSRPDRRAATLYTTLEPCLMCMGTAMSFFLGRIVFAAPAPADGASAVAEVWRPQLGHPRRGAAYGLPVVQGGLMAARSQELIRRWLDGGSGPEAEYARLNLGLRCQEPDAPGRA